LYLFILLNFIAQWQVASSQTASWGWGIQKWHCPLGNYLLGLFYRIRDLFWSQRGPLMPLVLSEFCNTPGNSGLFFLNGPPAGGLARSHYGTQKKRKELYPHLYFLLFYHTRRLKAWLN
jgi:hypothetical protein